ncbi:MAG: Hint domain-containing protein [Proteobacteria bacterium]|nr:Hint domain-containing protein [Pseudomonadota bacterium]MDA1153486.1 Hint domain-containing protein [Pseudomonadota bacterium]
MPSRSNAAPAYPALHDADATLRPESEAGRSRLNRKYTITCLTGIHIIETSIMAPAIPAFEDAFGALGRGTILQTRHGPAAVEDLMPGDSLRLIDGSFAPLLSRGMMTITQPARHSLTRITADALGIGRPLQDLVLGPAARLYHATSTVAKLTGKTAAYIPAHDFVDGNQFIALRPAAPVDVYQLGFAAHETLMVNGIGVESLHPGTGFSLGLRGQVLAQYLAVFPHLRRLDDVGMFRHPRLRLRDLDMRA